MKKKLFHDISASAVQVILNQGLGLVIFLITSRYLSKNTYGELNWSLAILTFTTTILSLRLEQVVVKRTASGENASKLLTLFAGHIFFSGIFFYCLLFMASRVWPAFFHSHDLLLLLAVSHLLSFFSTPFKQVANGREQFRILAVMSSVANITRATWLLVAVLINSFSIELVITVYIISSLIELIICFYLCRFKLKIPFDGGSRFRDYRVLIRESLPMAGAVILHATIARVDWILLGLFSGTIQTAEYSFAYKVFELSPVPLLIMAPVLLSRFSRFFSQHNAPDLLNRREEISMLIRISMFIATIIPLILNLVWAPVVDALTGGKYGAVNTTTFLVLSCCMPFLYMNNILWSIYLAQNQLKKIFLVTLVTFVLILGGDLLFIPRYTAIGAASVYLCATVIEYVNYLRNSALLPIHESWSSPVLCLVLAFLTGWLSWQITDHVVFRLLIALPSFCLLLLATKQLRKSDWIYIRHAGAGGPARVRPNST